MHELWAIQTALVSSSVTYAETAAAIAAARRSRRLSRRAMNEALRQLRHEWNAVEALDADEQTSVAAARLAVRHGLSGMDAIQLASAMTFAEAHPVVVTWDAQLGRAALAEGLAVAS